MSQRYAALIAAWRQAAEDTRTLQHRIKEKFDAHIAGVGEPPSDEELAQLQKLREREKKKLDAAMQYAKDSASAPPTGFGRL